MKKRIYWIIGAVIIVAAVLTWKLWPGEPSPYNLARQGGKWNAEHMPSAPDAAAPPDGVYTKRNQVTKRSITATMYNESEEAWGYGEGGWTLQVNVDGEWYLVPEKPGESRNYVLIGHSLNPGESVTSTYGFDVYGKLFSGTYRIVKEIHQGTIPESTFDQRYLTVEFEIG